jgi:hypothetical protein
MGDVTAVSEVGELILSFVANEAAKYGLSPPKPRLNVGMGGLPLLVGMLATLGYTSVLVVLPVML